MSEQTDMVPILTDLGVQKKKKKIQIVMSCEGKSPRE